MTDDKDDDWTGSMRKPWVNPPMKHHLGSARGSWRYAFGGFAAAFVAAIVVLALVRTDHLSGGWTYAALPVGGICAVSLLLMSVLKASSVDKRT